MSWIEHLSNFRGQQIKKVLYEVMKERYAKNEQIIDRLSVTLQTESDLKNFFTLVTDVYELAYLKAVEDHKEQLKKAGFVAKVVNPES